MRENTQNNNISELSTIRKIIDYVLFIYIMGTSIWGLLLYNKMLLPNLSIGYSIIYCIAFIYMFIGIIALLPIKKITKIFKDTFHLRWKKYRVIFIVLSYFISYSIIYALKVTQINENDIAFNKNTEIEITENNYIENVETDGSDQTSNNEENDYKSFDNKDTSSYKEKTYLETDTTSSSNINAINKARAYFAENEGEYDDLYIDLHMITIEKVDGTDDYIIMGNGFGPINSNQCIKVENDDEGNICYYFYEDLDYMDIYTKIVHDSYYDTIYYGETLYECSNICGQF